MQTISHSYKNIHPIFTDIEKYYCLVSEKEGKKSMIPNNFDVSFNYLNELFKYYGNTKHSINFIGKHYSKIDLPQYDSNNIILAFSGGKDSTAYAKILKDKGCNVYLYHVQNINAVFDERKSAQAIADYLELPIYFDTVKMSGHHEWIEHPMKNMIIANGAIHYGIRENIGTTIAFGNYINSTVENDSFDFCGGDDIEMWQAYEEIISQVIPNFYIRMNLENLGDTLDAICGDMQLLNLTQSCIGRAGLREYNRQRIRSKYHVELPLNRCGYCYKCCIEYVYMADRGLVEFNEAYYKNCIRLLRQNIKKEYGEMPDIYTLWDRFFFYDISESKLQTLKI